MSDFIMIAPEGWTILSVDYENNGILSPNMLHSTAMSTVLEVVTSAMLERGDMQPEQTVEAIQIINGEYWVKLV